MFELDEDHDRFAKTCRRFVEQQVLPLVASSEEQGTFPSELWRPLAEAGLLGLLAPEEFGGTGGDGLAVVILAEELARASGGLAITPLVSAYMAAPHIARYGTALQHERYLPRLTAGEAVFAIAVTEPGAGSDVAGIAATGIRVEGGWRLAGTKMFITNAGLADVVIVAVKTDPSAGHRGITTFIVEAGSPGLALGPPLKKMGWRSSDTREVVLDDCFVPDEQLLGTEGGGFYQIMGAFQLERLLLAAMGIGLAEAALDEADDYVRTRSAFGRPLVELQTVRHRLGAMRTEVAAARLLTYQGAQRLDAGHPGSEETVAMAKYLGARVANRAADEAVQLFGGLGFMDDTPVARHYRDARILRIGGGTDEIQLEILAKRAPT